jgi:hypothetical protein
MNYLNELNEEQIEEAILKISNILNKTKAYDKIGEALNIELDHDSQVFRDIEEYILLKLKEMQEDAYFERIYNGK